MAGQEQQAMGAVPGKKKITAPVFVTVFDIRHDMAAVRLSDKICGLVNACGEIIRKEGYCQSMKFMRNNFLDRAETERQV